MTALKEFLQSQGVSFDSIWDGIKDIAIKTIISIETIINSAMNMYVPCSKNCFELFGFDILIDENLRPWLLEVNLSPSMNTDTSIDLKIKSALISDLLNLVGIRRNRQKVRRNSQAYKPDWNHSGNNNILSKKEMRVVQETLLERQRVGNFEPCFPIENCLLYKQFLDVERPFNNLLMAHFATAKKDIHRNQLQDYENKLEIIRKELIGRNQTPNKNTSCRSRITTKPA